MSKRILHIIICFIAFSGFSQGTKEKVWKQEKELLKYQKDEKYKGPKEWYGPSPADMQDDDIVSTYPGSNFNPGIQYVPQQIQRDRNKRYQGFDRGGGGGTVPFDPKVERPDPLEVPDIDAPDIDLPDVDIDAPTISPTVWKVLLFILVAAIILVIAYLIIKNRQPANKKIVVDVEDDWNPEVISKSELELRLEEAIEKEDFRECVRIYFTFILKELIRKSWILWKKEKTNYDYVLEMHKKPNAFSFNECVRIYDLVWYGEYHIDKEIFSLLQPTLEGYYKSLNPVNE